MNAALRPCFQGGAAFKPRRVSRQRQSWVVALFFFPASLTPVSAESLFTLSGWIQPAAAPFSSYGDYVVMDDPLDRVRAILADPDGRFAKALPGRFHVQAAITQPRGPGDEPVFRIVPQDTAAFMSSSPDATGSPRWTAFTGELYAAEMNIVPRLSSSMGVPNPDSDGDGVPDSEDDFPIEPGEWLDTDKDGTGNNADPDDDNDGMSDAYEVLTGLNPLLPDATSDADGDGESNGREALAGTLANDPSSFFTLAFAEGSGPLGFKVIWQGLTTRTYRLETGGSPSGPWQIVLDGFRPEADGSFSHSIAAPTPSSLFFRATVTSP